MPSPPIWKPTKQQVQAAVDRTIPDVIAPGLSVLFCGINPGLYSAAVQRHFARPGNRFWPALHGAGFTDRRLSPFEDERLIEYGCGVTNLAQRATARADELTREELIRGADRLTEKAERHRPGWIAFVGITAYRAAFAEPRAAIGPQEHTIGPARVWVLPSTSGLNAHHRPADLADLFGVLKRAVAEGGGS